MNEVSSSYHPAERNAHQDETDEINFIEIDIYEKAQQLWAGRITIVIFTVFFLGIGLFHYTFAPEEYESSATLIQEGEASENFQGGGGLLQTLAGGLSGERSANSLSAAASGRAPLPVSLYPAIVSSTDFQKDLITKEIQFSDPDTTLTLFDYYQNYYEEPFRDRFYTFIANITVFLPETIYKSVRSLYAKVSRFFTEVHSTNEPNGVDNSDNLTGNTKNGDLSESRIQVISNEERSVIERLKTKIDLTAEGGLTTIIIKLPDGLAAAHANAILVEKLQEYITEYRIEKARQNLEAIRQQEDEARLRYEAAQKELASFQDQNINLSTNIAQTRVEHLRNQMDLRFQVYNSIAQEVEQARMSLEQQIPLFNVLEKPSLPSSPSSGSSTLLLIFSGFIGFSLGIFWVLIRKSSFFEPI